MNIMPMKFNIHIFCSLANNDNDVGNDNDDDDDDDVDDDDDRIVVKSECQTQ